MQGRTVYFENLDVLRALAFGAVFLFHVYGYLPYVPASAAEGFILDRFVREGHLGVNLFFVISGFLISYLLFTEKEQFGRIRIGYFYMRRVLRIWPLYMAVLLLSFIILPLATGRWNTSDLSSHGPWYLLFLNNFDRIVTGFTGIGNDSLGVMWSIAVEEQFYLLWPLLLSLFHRRYYPLLLGLIIVVSLVYRACVVHDDTRLYLHTASVMSDLAVGGLLAYSAVYQTSLLRWLQNCPRYVIVAVYVILFAAICWFREWSALNVTLLVSERLLLSLGFAFVIGEQCFAQNSFVKLGRWKSLSRVGLISYGLYCLHLFLIVVAQKLNQALHLQTLSPLLFYTELLLVLAGSLLVSALSYRYFEQPVLKLKARYMTLTTKP